jgi:hypothetical protein
MYRAAPSFVFAALGQARIDGLLTPEDESVLLAKLLTHWALASTLDSASVCASTAGTRAANGAIRLRSETRLTIH